MLFNNYARQKFYKSLTSNLILFLLVLSFEDHFKFLLFLNKYLNINRNFFFDLNIVKEKKRQGVKSQSIVSKSDSTTLSLFIVPWLLLQSFDRFFLIESYLHSSFWFNISLQFLLVTSLKGFYLIAQEGFGSLFFKDAV